MNSILRLIFICAIVLLYPYKDFGQKVKENSDLKHWPDGSSPQEIGKRVAEHFVIRPLPDAPSEIIYPEVCAWYGALTFAHLTGDNKLLTRLEERFSPLFRADSILIPVPNHVDNTVFGSVPLELYLLTKDLKYLTLGRKIADRQWALPEGTGATPESMIFYEKGYTPQTRMWIDDMYMITAVQVQAYRATGDKKYIERAAKEMVLYLDSLQRPNGLFFHAQDVPFFWSRGNGWMAAGMSELLSSLPENNPNRPRIMEGYKKMMTSLLKYQTENGTWRQLIDEPESWYETSGTGMFAFAMITGVKNGWLDKTTYGAAARKAWLGLISFIDQNDDVREVCEGTNKKNDRQYYFDRKRNVGDLHGQAPILWCASALLR
jgi:Predicted unsaturated glucuronyl hydrolase involved in regulation of bacterial surface properties, and related proteins